jgi:hypothetical protein
MMADLIEMKDGMRADGLIAPKTVGTAAKTNMIVGRIVGIGARTFGTVAKIAGTAGKMHETAGKIDGIGARTNGIVGKISGTAKMIKERQIV